jgi:hypothetical protein
MIVSTCRRVADPSGLGWVGVAEALAGSGLAGSAGAAVQHITSQARIYLWLCIDRTGSIYCSFQLHECMSKFSIR